MIKISGLTKKFGTVTALDGVSLEIADGEMFFLLGPSGCGKTTMLRILAGLETPDAGSIEVDGRDILGLPPHRRGFPMVFQNYALWPHLDVGANVGFGLVEQGVAKNEIRERTAQVLSRVGLEGMEGRMPSQLSGGQQQRVVLARALVLNPKVILLDEPLSNLDAKLRTEMREHIGNLHAGTEITFVYVTHDQAEALSLADRMAVMSGGRVMATGAPADLYDRPPNRFCASFLGAANLFDTTAKPVGDGTTALEGPFCKWRGVAASPAAASGRALCMIRPESIRPALSPRDDENAFLGEIVSLRRAGGAVSLVLKAGDVVLRASLPSREAGGMKTGDHMLWTVAMKDTILIPGE